MKILQVSNHYKPCVGGVERVAEEIAKRMHKHSYECGVVCLNKCADGKKLKKEETIDGIKVHRLHYINLKYYKIATGVLKFARKDFDVLLVHGLGFMADFLASTKFLHKKPMVLFTHGGIFHTKKIGRMKNFYFKVPEKVLLRKYDKIVAVSKNDYEKFSKIVPKNKLVLIENGIDFDEFQGARGLGNANNFIFVGRLSKNKRIDNLLRAFALVSEKIQGAKLFIVGKDFDGIKQELEKLAKKLNLKNKIEFVDEVERNKLLELIKGARFFASASEYEGFGISALEALAAGKMVVLNNIPSFQNFVKDGENGFIVDFANEEEAAKVMIKAAQLSEEERRRISENAIETTRKYDWESKVREIEKICEELK